MEDEEQTVEPKKATETPMGAAQRSSPTFESHPARTRYSVIKDLVWAHTSVAHDTDSYQFCTCPSVLNIDLIFSP